MRNFKINFSILIIMLIAFIIPLAAFAEVSILKGTKVAKFAMEERRKYQWCNTEKYKKVFIVLSTDAPTVGSNEFTINDRCAIIEYWSPEVMKLFTINYIYPNNYTFDHIVDINKNNKLLMHFVTHQQTFFYYKNNTYHFKGKRKENFIKSISGFSFTIKEAKNTMFLKEAGAFKWNLRKTNKFNGGTSCDAIKKIIDMLQKKGYTEWKL